MRSRRRLAIPTAIMLTIAVVLLLPIVIDSELLEPICFVEQASAQDDNQCLAQEATLSAQQLDILAFQITNEAQQAEILALEGTIAILELPGRSPIIITQPIVVTATVDPQATTPVAIVTPTTALPTLDRGIDFELPPTIATSQVEIVQVVAGGDPDEEHIEVRNNGQTVNIGGWTLSDINGNVYSFREQLLFSNATLRIFTRVGQDTPVALYWGLDPPVWEINDVAILTDDDGNVQSTLRIDSPNER